MPKRIFLVHGWSGNPQNNWFPWIQRKLESRGFEVYAPAMPNPDEPRMDAWIPALAAAVGQADRDTFFVGHSMGCQTIVRYLQTLPDGLQVGGAVFVGGFFKRLTNEDDDPEDKAIADEWLNAPIDFKALRARIPKSVAIFSDNDPSVPLDNQDDFRDKLGSEIIMEHRKGHFSDDAGITELPSALEAVLRMAE